MHTSWFVVITINLVNPFNSSSFRRRLKGIHSRPDTNRTGAKGLSFYYPRLLHCLDQMLAVMLLSQHSKISSSKTVRPRAPCGARCMGHIVSTWSAVCSEAPHSQFGEGARPHLCMDEWNRPTPVRRRLSLIQAARGKPIPTGLTLVPGTKVYRGEKAVYKFLVAMLKEAKYCKKVKKDHFNQPMNLTSMEEEFAAATECEVKKLFINFWWLC